MRVEDDLGSELLLECAQPGTVGTFQGAAGFRFWHAWFADTRPRNLRPSIAKILHVDDTVIILKWCVGIGEGELHRVCSRIQLLQTFTKLSSISKMQGANRTDPFTVECTVNNTRLVGVERAKIP